jgi:hypothetical protein
MKGKHATYKKNTLQIFKSEPDEKMANTAKLYQASNPKKKYMICYSRSKKWINFGQLGYQDYKRHKNICWRNSRYI